MCAGRPVCPSMWRLATQARRSAYLTTHYNMHHNSQAPRILHDQELHNRNHLTKASCYFHCLNNLCGSCFLASPDAPRCQHTNSHPCDLHGSSGWTCRLGIVAGEWKPVGPRRAQKTTTKPDVCSGLTAGVPPEHGGAGHVGSGHNPYHKKVIRRQRPERILDQKTVAGVKSLASTLRDRSSRSRLLLKF